MTAMSAVVLGCVLVSHANAQTHNQVAANQTPLAANLFYNYYTQGPNQVNAQMYLAPRPVPAYVGHSYYTYQPLLPHEHMYSHVRNYYNWYAGPEALYDMSCSGRKPGCALNKTTVVYRSGLNFVGPQLSNLAVFNQIQARYANRVYTPEFARRALRPYGANIFPRGAAGGRTQGGCATGNCGGGGGCATGSCATRPRANGVSR